MLTTRRSGFPITWAALLIAGISPAVSPPASAQFPPDSATNLKVFPEDIEIRALINNMRGFALGLGVRCQFCHVGEEGMPLDSFDFAADEKTTKLKAREMIKMVRAINDEHLARLEERSDPALTVTCATCHRGLSKPRMLQDVLLATYDEGGIDSVMEKYNQLREQYYGSFSYDFSEWVTCNRLVCES